MTRRRLFLCISWATLLLSDPFSSPVLAHNPDTSYARIQISSNLLTIRLTYDPFTLLKIVPLDRNNDRQITEAEVDAGAGQIASFLKQHVAVEINERLADLGELKGFVWPFETPAIPEIDYHSAASLLHFDFVQPVEDMPEDVAVTFNFFEQLGERHAILGVFQHGAEPYEVVFTRFEPDFLYDTGYRPPMYKRLVKFLKLGVEHIFLGYDHICFLIALIVVSRFRELVLIVTSFTVAHSITLILAALEIVKLPTRLIEAGVAATIVYVAVENLWIARRSPAGATANPRCESRWKLTFFFGLIHGFGFANVLRDLGLPSEGLIRLLLSFNVGVELGQLAIVAVAFPLAVGLSQWKHGEKAKAGISVAILLFGLAWLADRALNLEFMPI